MVATARSRYNLRHLRAFALVAETGTARAAAEEAGLSQPAVTQALARLEQQFGRRLFERASIGMRLNEDGGILLVRVRRLFSFLETLRRRVNAARRGRRGIAVDRLVTMVQLRTLIAIAETKGFAAAARATGVSEPTVHRAARGLEKVLDVDLFHAVSTGIELTAIGREVARLAGLALKELVTAAEELAEAAGKRGGKIVIGSLPLARTEVLPMAIARLCEREPLATVEIFEGVYENLMHMLRKGDVDLIIGALRERIAYNDVIQTSLFEDDLSVVARAGHPLAARGRLAMEDLFSYPWAVPRNGTPTRWHFDALFDKRSEDYGLIETSSMILLRSLLLKSDRLTLLSRRQILYEEQQGLLVALPVDLPATRRAIGYAKRGDWHPSPLQQRFLDCLHQVAIELTAAVPNGLTAR